MTNYTVATLYGISGSISHIGSTAINTGTYGTFIFDSLSVTKTADFIPLTDQTNELIGGTTVGKRIEISGVFIPRASTSDPDDIDEVKTLIKNIPYPVGYITLAGTADDTLPGDYNILSGVTISHTADGRCGIQMNVVKFDSIAAATLATVAGS